MWSHVRLPAVAEGAEGQTSVSSWTLRARKTDRLLVDESGDPKVAVGDTVLWTEIIVFV